jgi:glycosyltransferase involved in cell wall biosynthesis
MWPGFRMSWQRRLNAGLISKAVNGMLRSVRGQARTIAVTTLPITADLIGRLDVDRWVYYCVDDFSAWPGLDGPAMLEMEYRQVRSVDKVVTVSEPLRERLLDLGRDAELLTHGVDLAHWSHPAGATGAKLPRWWTQLSRPIMLFWGLVDRRLDVDWCRSLPDSMPRGGTLVLLGPQQSPDTTLRVVDRVVMPGPVSYQHLPWFAADADVLVMPYADLPVTQAMQPLKLKEYLATGKPVVVRDLPATRDWADAADVVGSLDQWLAAVRERARTGAPASQLEARRRLARESWKHKAKRFEMLLAVP